jgi:histone acetyltransferase (RNA polymerase elongator complex component)
LYTGYVKIYLFDPGYLPLIFIFRFLFFTQVTKKTLKFNKSLIYPCEIDITHTILCRARRRRARHKNHEENQIITGIGNSYMAKQQITIPIFIPHLGCTHRCIFCSQWRATAAHAIPGPAQIHERVREYVPFIKKSVRRVELAFFGGSFTGIRKEIQESLLAAANVHLKTGTIQAIRLSTRPDYISEETLGLLGNYHVSTIELGIQSFNDAVLLTANRGHTAADAYAAVRLIKNHGFEYVLQLMPGLPCDTRESSLDSARRAAALEPSAVRIYPAVVLGGTAMETLFMTGAYVPLSLDGAVDLCKDMYLIFKSSGIPVIRMGLHPFSPGNIGTVVAGPYHPSFGFLVKSRARRDELVALADQYRREHAGVTARSIHVAIPQSFKEEFIGDKKENIRYLKKLFNFDAVDYSVEPVSEIQIV